MTITQIKQQISGLAGFTIIALNMVRQYDEETGTIPQEWLSHWDNEHRVRVTMHQEVLETIKSNPLIDKLAVKHEVVEPEGKAPYRRFVVITPKNIEACL